MQTILLTCGRGPYPLTLARAFHEGGHTVLVADAWARTSCRFSAAVGEHFHVPSPARDTEAWVAALAQIIQKKRVDLIVPVYEEAFHLAKAIGNIPDAPPLFAPDFETLIRLHDKWRFNQTARSLGLRAPETVLLTSREELVTEFTRDPQRAFKPVYSRFAAYARVKPASLEAFDGIEPTQRRPWVAQAFLPGRPYATFSVAHGGRLTAHVTYATDFSHDLGPTVVYRRAEQPAVEEWVRTLVKSLNFTGQLGIDFIEDANGEIAAIECNPRLTGGVYLIKDSPRFADAYLNPAAELLTAARDRSYAFRFWLLFTLFHHTRSFPGFREWCRQFFFARSTTGLDLSDPVPQLYRPFLAAEFLGRCWWEGKNVREMVTQDFEWSEDPAAGEAPDSSRRVA